MLACPVCQSALTLNGKNLSCENNHSFDQARQGYFNLLLNTAKNSQSPGDNAAMVKSRQQFLDSGLYKNISDTVNQLVVEHLLSNPVQSPGLLDLACGEGYYTQQLHRTLEDHQVQHTLHGLDISKDAIKAGARREKSINWIVANGFKAPFKPNSLHCVLNMFNRVNSKSLHQLCHPQGKVIVASSARFHLQQ
jgi:23S rRNA (guanine745-N1)-methyltransferase